MSSAVLIILVTAGVWRLGVKLLAAIAPVFKTEQVEIATGEEESPREAQAASQAVHDLGAILDAMAQAGKNAGTLMADAKIYTITLIKLTEGLSLKVESMQIEREFLQQALVSISKNQPTVIHEAAGQITDDHIRELMLSTTKSEEYWAGVSNLLARQVGTMNRWERGYRRMTTNLLVEISRTKDQLTTLHASLDLIEVSQPLLKIQDNLQKAGHQLQLDQQPGLYQTAHLLPSSNAKLLGAN